VTVVSPKVKSLCGCHLGLPSCASNSGCGHLWIERRRLDDCRELFQDFRLPLLDVLRYFAVFKKLGEVPAR
jgi:hypothetical protein